MMRPALPLALIALLAASAPAAPDDTTPDDTPAAGADVTQAPAARTPDADAAADAKAKAIAEREEGERKALEFVTHYYEHPDLGAVPLHVNALSASGWMRDWRNYAALVGFLTPLLQANPEKAEPWLDEWSKLPDPHFAALIGAVWLADIEGADDLMGRQLSELNDEWRGVITGQYSEDPFDILTVADPEPYQFEMLWGWYDATGDERCLERVLFFTADVRENDNLAQDATTSLSYNAAVHPSVKAWCERELAKVTAEPDKALPEAPQLEAILEDAAYVRDNREALELSDFGVPR